MEHLIICEVCGARNRVRSHSKQRQPICGKCHAPLKEKLFDRVMQTVGTVVSEAGQIFTDLTAVSSSPQPPPRETPPTDQTIPGFSFDPELHQVLSHLAEVAWTNPNRSPEGFLLMPDRLGCPTLSQEIRQTFDRLYAHVRTWAPGFNVPYSLPEVRIVPMDDRKTAGQFAMGEHPVVTVVEKYLATPPVLRLILAHEACHHILHLSSLEDPNRQANERKTDLSMFICGFGEITQQGYATVQRQFLTTHILHLGYLQPREYQQAYKWARQRRDEVFRNIDRFPGAEAQLYRRLLTIVHGDQQALERWRDRAANRYPRLATVELYQTMLDEYQRDNR